MVRENKTAIQLEPSDALEQLRACLVFQQKQLKSQISLIKKTQDKLTQLDNDYTNTLSELFPKKLYQEYLEICEEKCLLLFKLNSNRSAETDENKHQEILAQHQTQLKDLLAKTNITQKTLIRRKNQHTKAVSKALEKLNQDAFYPGIVKEDN